jgi:undecaprenyl-diphosphatase
VTADPAADVGAEVAAPGGADGTADPRGATLLLAGALAAFVLIARRVATTAAAPWDAAVRHAVQAHRTAAGDRAARPLVLLGRPAVAVPMTLGAAWWLHAQGRRAAAGTLLLAPALAMTAGAACSAFLVQRPPPDAGGGAGTVVAPSFPSGHTTGVTAEALTVAYVLHRERLAPPALLAALLVCPVLVGTTRVYRDRHWASDIVGGWAAGTAVAAACVLWYEYRRASAPSTSPPGRR